MNESPTAEPVHSMYLVNGTIDTGVLISHLKKRWRIQTRPGLRRRCEELGKANFLIEDVVPTRSLSIVVGDSGLGKSPFLYQAAMCVAEGVPFLGHVVSKGRVLFLDFENGIQGVDELTTKLSAFLGITHASENLLLWNYNDAAPEWKPDLLAEMIADVKPTWIIIDSLSAFSPDIEEKSSNVTRTYQIFRDVIKDHSVAITVVHHIRKPSNKPGEAGPPLEEDPRGWFLQTRGSRQLINGMDVRIGIDHSRIANAYEVRRLRSQGRTRRP